MIVGHVIWVVVPALIGVMGTGVGWLPLVLALALFVALVLVVVAWASRTSSIAAARAVAWVSTPLLGIAVGLLAIAYVGGAILLTDVRTVVTATVSPAFGVSMLVFVVVPLVVVSVPTIGAFLAAVSHARSLRGGGV
jgi:hypothetical protein